jgi:hypothetical protein
MGVRVGAGGLGQGLGERSSPHRHTLATRDHPRGHDRGPHARTSARARVEGQGL